MEPAALIRKTVYISGLHENWCGAPAETALALWAHNVRPDETGRGTACVGAHIMRPRGVSCRLNGTDCPFCVKQSTIGIVQKMVQRVQSGTLSRCGRTVCARTKTGRGTACVGAHIMRPRSVSCRLNGTGCPSCVKQSIYQDCTKIGAVRQIGNALALWAHNVRPDENVGAPTLFR